MAFGHKKAIAIILVFSAFAACPSWAQPIYRAKSPSGKSSYYSTKPSQKGEKPVELPQIMRVDPSGRIVVRQTCKTHGGINCSAEADRDGSVVCNDGFRGSEERFNFNCTAPKLEIVTVSEADAPATFKAVVRNLGSTMAKNVSVVYRPNPDEIFTLEGTKEIRGFEVAEYVYRPVDSKRRYPTPSDSMLDIDCTNCP